jgi:hypothetical protein
MIEPLIPPEKDIEALVKYFKKTNEVTGAIQKDISIALLRDPAMQKKVSDQLKMSENDAQLETDKVVKAFINEMPKATLNGYNLFSKVFAMHANITGDPTMHDVFDEVNRQVFDEMKDY